MVALDVAGLFQGPHAAQAGRGRNSGTLCQIDVGHAPIALQIAQDLPVDAVKFHPLHGVPVFKKSP